MREDYLEAMMDRQAAAQKKYHDVDFTTMTNAKRIEFITWNVLALEDELHEALNEVGWKPWATSQHINEEALCGELIDAWHFLMNLFLVAGMAPEEVFDRYNTKRSINDKRMEDGYTGLNKCPRCWRALDDPEVQCDGEWCGVYGDMK